MTVTQFKDTPIPKNYSTGLYHEKGYDVAESHTAKVLEVMVLGVTECLASVKSKDYPVVYSFAEKNGEFIAAAIVQYFANEDDPSKPGNWNYSWTFDKEDIPEEGARVIDSFDLDFVSYFRAVGMTKYGMVFDQPDYAGDLFRYLLTLIKNYLNDNASETDEKAVKYDGLIQFRVAVEDGEKVMSIEVDGEVKQLIKDDASIEA